MQELSSNTTEINTERLAVITHCFATKIFITNLIIFWRKNQWQLYKLRSLEAGNYEISQIYLTHGLHMHVYGTNISLNVKTYDFSMNF